MVLSVMLLSMVLMAKGQVMFRNDIVLGRHQKVKNKGISFIMISFDRYPNRNMLAYGRGGKTLVIDVQAIRNPKKEYSYAELAERIYTPGPVYKPGAEPVPLFLLLPPPVSLKMPVYSNTHH
jgi:hypothetical protein